MSLFGIIYEYTSTHSQIASTFARTSFGADHHRIVAIAAFGHIENDYEDYLGTGEPLKTEDDLKALVARYLFRAKGDWFIGTQRSAANYQVLGATAEDDLVLETLGVRGFSSAAVGAVLMHPGRADTRPLARPIGARSAVVRLVDVLRYAAIRARRGEMCRSAYCQSGS